MKKVFSWIPRRGIPLVICVAMACLLVYSIYLRFNASSMGAGIGQGIGSFTGTAVGSIEGMTTGRREGADAGKAAGLSAEDTEIDLATELQQISNLEVLVASVKITDIHSIGKDVDYCALYLIKGEVVFAVDLSKADIKLQGEDYYITLPEPKGQLIIDQSQIDKAAEYQKTYFSGSTEAGFDAYKSSMEKVQEATAETLDNYSVLLEAARESARKQVTQLAASMSSSNRTVYIEFKSGGQEDE